MQTQPTKKPASGANTKKNRRRRRSRLRPFQRALFFSLPVLLLIMLALLAASHIKRTSDPVPADSASVSDPAADTPPSSEPEAPADDTASSDTPDVTDVAVTEEPEADETMPEEPASEPVTLVFTGDVLLSDYVLNNYNSKGIAGVVSPDVLTELTQADLTVINNEFPFSTRGTKAPDKQFTFRVDPSYVSVLTDMGVDIAGLANNHVLDYGSDALLDTFETLDNAGIDYIDRKSVV